MSQKIEGLPPPAVRATGPTNPQVGKAGGERSSPVTASQAGDNLRLTGEAASMQVMQRELSSASAIDMGRVEAIRASLQDGSYKINAEAVADGLLGMEDTLGA